MNGKKERDYVVSAMSGLVFLYFALWGLAIVSGIVWLAVKFAQALF